MKTTPKNKITLKDLQRTVRRTEKVLSTAEFKERIKAICGLRPTPYYNPPVEPSPLVRRHCQ